MSILSTMLALAASATIAGTQEPQPDVTIYRSWRPPNVTVVEGMFRVDPELLGTPDCNYGVQFTVRDQRGTELKKEQWTGRCPVNSGVPVAGLETFAFQVVPATYSVVVEVYPLSQPDRRRTRTLEVRAEARDPLVSDLILARDVGFIDTTQAEAWTMRRGTIGLQTSSQMVVRVEEPSLAYYFEVYPEENRPMSGAVYGVVKRPDGRELARFKLQDLQQQGEPRPIAGEVSVEGLPPGAYSFETQIQLGDTMLVRSHPFYVGAPAVAAGGERGWFWTLTDERLAELFDPVVVWLTRSEAEVFSTLPPDGRREFLSRQFGRGGPTPEDGQESALDAFLARTEAVRARFGERSGRGTTEPWRTDRGRIYMIRGEPAQQVSRPSPQSGSPYELWYFGGRTPYVYLFADDTRMGHFRLIYTNDPNETSLPDWDRQVSPEALDDMERFGIRVRSQGS
jgi:GWxTD domain-containing protein